MSMAPSFTLSNMSASSSLSSLISTYLHRAGHVYSSVHSTQSDPIHAPRIFDLFSVPGPSTDAFLAELNTLSGFLDTNPSTSDQFAAIELTGLSKIAAAFGRTSEQYLLAAQATRAMLESALSQHNLHFVLLTFDGTAAIKKRALQPPKQTPFPKNPLPQQPISGVSTCYASADICTNKTGECSGRGECVEATKAGRTCFICACETIVTDKGKKETWVGDACERKDISA